MGAWDWVKDKGKYVVPGTDNFFSVADPANLTGHNGDQVSSQPGVVGGQSQLDSFRDLKQDPVTGLYYDPTNGEAYVDKFGKQQVTNPNVAQQVATNYNQANALLGGVQQARATAAAANAGQAGLVKSYDGVISGTAPSVAGSQLAGTLGNIERTQSSLASGFGGNNAFSARRAAAANIGNSQIAASQQAAQLRAQETAAAMTGKGAVLNAMSTNANTQAGQDIAGGAEYSGLALKGQQAQQGMNTDAEKQHVEAETKRKAGIPGMIGSLFA